MAGKIRLVLSLLAALACSQVVAADGSWPDTLVIGTAARGGTYDAYGRGLADLLGKRLDLPVATRETEGPQENLDLLRKKEIQVGFTTLGIAFNLLKDPSSNIRAAFPMYETAFHFSVPQDSTIKSLRDLDGKTVGVGPAGGTTAFYAPLIFKVLGVTPVFKSGEWDALGAQLAANGLDMLATAGGTPFPALLDLGTKRPLRFVSLDASDLSKVHFEHPELAITAVPKGVYPWSTDRYRTVGMFNFAVVDKDLPPSLVSAMLDAVFTNPEALLAATSAAAETSMAYVTRNTFIPFHAGAVDWYQKRMPSAEMGD